MSYAISPEEYGAFIATGQLERRERFRIPKPPTDGPTEARPGTEGKITILAERFGRDEQIFHPGDLTVEQWKIFDALAYGTAHHHPNGAPNNDREALTILSGAS